jgi:hypothetical protein
LGGFVGGEVGREGVWRQWAGVVGQQERVWMFLCLCWGGVGVDVDDDVDVVLLDKEHLTCRIFPLI